jgi:hypothetical protein
MGECSPSSRTVTARVRRSGHSRWPRLDRRRGGHRPDVGRGEPHQSGHGPDRSAGFSVSMSTTKGTRLRSRVTARLFSST